MGIGVGELTILLFVLGVGIYFAVRRKKAKS